MAKVYALYCEHEDKSYVGCTRGSLAKRFREHRCLLKAGKHTCGPLQNAWDRGMRFEVILLAESDDDLESRREAELFVFGTQNGHLYNDAISFRPAEDARQKGVEASRHVVGNKRSPEANRKRSLAQKGKPKGHGAKISATKQARKAQQVMR